MKESTKPLIMSFIFLGLYFFTEDKGLLIVQNIYIGVYFIINYLEQGINKIK